jgi:hypothetical protein
MHGTPLDPENQSHAEARHLEHLNNFDQRIIRALEAAPEPHIPPGFAARVARQLPAKRPESLTPTHYGRWAMVIATVATLAALLVLALHSADYSAGHVTGHPTFGVVESILFAQFLALAVWLSVWRPGLR